jgi:5-methylcytosine-specific restriction endonuclease McrA
VTATICTSAVYDGWAGRSVNCPGPGRTLRRSDVPKATCRKGHDLTDPAIGRLDKTEGRVRCRLCELARHRAYERTHRTEANDRYRRWREANPERAHETARASQERYRAKNRAVLRDRRRRWHAANPERARELGRAAERRRRTRLAGGEVLTVTAQDWTALCARYGNRCAYCGAPGPLQKDHIIPITRGGRHAIGNLLPACKSCNTSKGNRLLSEWRRRTHRPLLPNMQLRTR